MRSHVLAGWIVAIAVVAAGCGTAAPSSSPAPPPAAKKGAHGVRGQVTAENGSTWTVTNAKGKAFTVNITPQTTFGTKKAPAAQAQFAVGSQVRVAGTASGTTITATRVAAAKPPGGAPAPASPAPAAAVPGG